MQVDVRAVIGVSTGLPAVDVAWRRLTARGAATITMRPGRTIAVNWWPPGQEGNPFCQRSWTGRLLSEMIIEAERATRPPTRSIEDARWYREQDELAKQRFRDRVRELSDRG